MFGGANKPPQSRSAVPTTGLSAAARAPGVSGSTAFNAGAAAASQIQTGASRSGLPAGPRVGTSTTATSSSLQRPVGSTPSTSGSSASRLSSAYSAVDAAHGRGSAEVANSASRGVTSATTTPTTHSGASSGSAVRPTSSGFGPSPRAGVSGGLASGAASLASPTAAALPGSVSRPTLGTAVAAGVSRLAVATDGGSSGAGGAGSAAAAPSPRSGQGMSPHGLVRKERLKFALSELALSTTVGTGTFGRVRLAYHKPSKSWHVLKILKKSEVIRLKQVEHIKDEVRILGKVYHPFIVNMLGFLQDDRRMYMLLEYVPGGELFSHLRREGKFSEAASRFYASEIILAFEYLHQFNIVYRDLKPENLLITAKGHIKITDFGFAKTVTDQTYTLCGTPEYLAPEIIQSRGHSKGVDWWAIGILIYEMLAGYPPFYDENPYGIYQKILGGKIEWPKWFTEPAKDLIKKLLTADRTRRLGCLRSGAADIKEHPWFKGLNWDTVYACGIQPPYVPKVRSPDDTSNFDDYPDSDGDTAGRLSSSDAALFADLDNF